MVNLSLTACSFHFNCKNKQQAICNLNENIKGKTFIELFKEFFNKYNRVIVDHVIQKTFSCDQNSITVGETEEYQYIYALIRSGIYGNSSDIMDIANNKVNYKKKANESEVLPFYLFVAIPKDSKSVHVQKGIFLFQNVGIYGVKTITTQYMRDFFQKIINLLYVVEQ